MKQPLRFPGSALFLALLPFTATGIMAEEATVTSPDGKLIVVVSDTDAQPTYTVTYEGQTVITPSPLGIRTDLHFLYTEMKLTETKTGTVTDDYTLNRCKTSSVHYEANQLLATFESTNAPAPAAGNRRPGGPRRNSGAFSIEFQVSNNNVAFRYIIPEEPDRRCAVVRSEATSFTFPENTTTFLTPQLRWEPLRATDTATRSPAFLRSASLQARRRARKARRLFPSRKTSGCLSPRQALTATSAAAASTNPHPKDATPLPIP